MRRNVAEANGVVGNGASRQPAKGADIGEPALLKLRVHKTSPLPKLGKRTQRIALPFIAAVLLGIVFYQMRAIIVPLVGAIVIGSTIGPYADYAERRGIPPVVIYSGIVLLLCLIPYLAIVWLSEPVSSWIARAPEVGALVEGKLKILERPLGAWREIKDSLQALGGGAQAPEIQVATTLNDFVTTVMALVTPAIGQFLVFFGALIFFLSGRRQLKQHLTLSFGDRRARLTTLRVISDIEASLTTYLTTATIINLGVGAATGVAAGLFGIANPVMWGLAAFICNFIPYVGPLLVAIVFVFVGLLTFDGLLQAMALPLAYILIVAVENQFVTPTVMSRRLEMNPFLVFVGIVFWSWLWGLAGAFLALPILIAGHAVVRHVQPIKEKDALP
ncbi:MAG TPA: AI-2E family transporter [Aestuariivirgaceae bacterium]